MVGELQCDIIYIALGYNSSCVYIDAGCSTGIIPNTVTYHAISYGFEILPNQYEVEMSMANNLINESPESVSANFFKRSICDSEMIGPQLDHDNIWIWFNNFDRCV